MTYTAHELTSIAAAIAGGGALGAMDRAARGRPHDRDANVDDSLAGLERADLLSDLHPGVSYRLGDRLGEGGMAVAFYAMRIAANGKTPTVVKLMKPSIVQGGSETAQLIVRKEAVALGRLNERVPPTPYVVRLFDTGVVSVRYSGRVLSLPWLALEHVRGGAEGTTLRARVQNAIRQNTFAFDAHRAGNAIRGIANGLDAVHDVGVIHRDMKPDNVLCCGFGEEEVCKVADFGIARPAGMTATFGAQLMGTPGYAPPELAGLDATAIGPWTDVFALACVAFFVLTGEEYFPFEEPGAALRAMRQPRRRSLLDCPALDESIRARPGLCAAIDRAIARATAFVSSERPQSAESFAQEIVPWLRNEARRPPASPRALSTLTPDDEQTRVQSLRWVVRSEPIDDFVVRSVAWEADGRCLAATNRGLSAWTGSEWVDVPVDGIPRSAIRFVERLSAERWLIGGDDGLLASLGREGVRGTLRLPDVRSIERFSGDLDDIAVALTVSRSGEPTLHATIARRWLKAMPLSGVAHVMGLARLGDATWLLCGRRTDGRGFAAKYLPLEWELDYLDVPPVRAMLTCAARADLGVGIAAGALGTVVCIEERTANPEQLGDQVDVSAAAIDVAGRAWVATAGRIYARVGVGRDARWRKFWSDERWTAPVVSLQTDGEVTRALCADGSLLEGTLAPTKTC